MRILTCCALALCIATTAQAESDLLGNPTPEGHEPGAPHASASPIQRDDFGECAITIDFDELQGGTPFCDGDQISDQYPGVVFNVPFGDCLVCAVASFTDEIPNSGPNVAFFQQNNNACAAKSEYGEIVFDPPIQMVGMDYFISSHADFTLRIYDGANTVIDAITVEGESHGDFRIGFVGLDARRAAISRVEVKSDGHTAAFNFAVDDFVSQAGPCETPAESHTWGRLKSRMVHRRNAQAR